MRRLMLAAMLGLGMLSGAASAAPGPATAESGLMMPVQYQRHYAPPPPRAYGRRYYAPPRRYAPPPRRHYRHYAPPRGRYLPPPRPYYGR